MLATLALARWLLACSSSDVEQSDHLLRLGDSDVEPFIEDSRRDERNFSTDEDAAALAGEGVSLPLGTDALAGGEAIARFWWNTRADGDVAVPPGILLVGDASVEFASGEDAEAAWSALYSVLCDSETEPSEPIWTCRRPYAGLNLENVSGAQVEGRFVVALTVSGDDATGETFDALAPTAFDA